MILVLLILVAAWAAVLVPPWVRDRRESHPADSILSFHRQLSTLERTTPAGRPAARPGLSSRPARSARSGRSGRSVARRRRRDILFTLAATTGLTLAMALALRGVAILACLVVSAALFSYVVLLARAQKRSLERAAKVRHLAPQPRPREPALLLHRSVPS